MSWRVARQRSTWLGNSFTSSSAPSGSATLASARSSSFDTNAMVLSGVARSCAAPAASLRADSGSTSRAFSAAFTRRMKETMKAAAKANATSMPVRCSRIISWWLGSRRPKSATFSSEKSAAKPAKEAFRCTRGRPPDSTSVPSAMLTRYSAVKGLKGPPVRKKVPMEARYPPASR
jgi:hypothetical protein